MSPSPTAPPAPPDGGTPDLTEMGQAGLQRVLGVPALFSTAYGNVGSSIYYALGLVASFALGLTPLAFLFAGLFFVMTALSYAEATVAYPEAGGASSFARHAFNEFVSFVTAWTQLLNYIITMSISAFFVPHYLGVFWEALKSPPHDVIGGCIVIALLAALNIVGVKETATLNVALALVDLGTQILLAALGVMLLLDPGILVANVELGVAPSWSEFLVGITVAMIAFTGIETVSNMAEETRDPLRSVPRAIGWVVAAVFALYTILPLVALSALPVTRQDNGEYETRLGTEFQGNPIMGLVEQFPTEAAWVQTALQSVVGIIAAVILCIATNAAIIGVSRVSYSMGQHQQVPSALRTLHPRFLTPWISIMVFALIGCAMLLPPLFGVKGEEELLGNLYAFGAMLSFSIAHLAVIRMRWRRDEMPWRAPLNVRVGTRVLPLFALVGLAGTGTAWMVQVATHPVERTIGLAWVLCGPILYVLYRRSRGLDLTSTIRAPLMIAAPSAKVAYNNILVPVLAGRLDHAAMVVACKLAAERGAQILALAVIEVPRQLPLHASLDEPERQANLQLDAARMIGQEYGVTVITRLLRARNADMAVLGEALRRESQLIVVGVPPRRHLGMSLMGRSLERILRKAPTRVVLVRERDDFSAAGDRNRFVGSGDRE